MSYLFAIKSESMLLRRSTRFWVRRYFWYMLSKSHQGDLVEKKSFSDCLACFQVIFDFRSLEDGCLTQNQLFSSDSFSFRINGSQFISSPMGMRSGFVKTPTRIRVGKLILILKNHAHRSFFCPQDHIPWLTYVLPDSRSRLCK